jgi:hypothetical protein
MNTHTTDQLNAILTAHALWSSSGGTQGLCANLADANLAGANLAGANLTRAELAGAYLADADLAGAYLAGANLAGANLAGADLTRAELAGADLTGAYLAGANLADANLAGADLTGAYLTRADLAGAELADADLTDAYLTRADLALIAPVVPSLNKQILAAVEGPHALGALDMARWHTCETTHCLAGWAVHLAGTEGYALERAVGPRRAGAMIFRASTGSVPHFSAPNDRALADLRERAAKES